MNYISTRGYREAVSGARAIKKGIAPDSGLYLPENIPELKDIDFERMLEEDYPRRAARILRYFLDDYSREELERYAEAAYSQRFSHPAVAPLLQLDQSAFILELWHGPTCAFKDLALQIMPYLLTAALKKTGENKEAVILVATSGDTGKAALEGFRDVPQSSVFVFYPSEGVSGFQKLQMATQEGKNVGVMAVEGNFDDAQTGVKEIFGDPAFRDKLARRGKFLSSANSINWGRLVPQIAYYISAYLELAARGALTQGEPANIVVPTGNFGNILAAYYAKRMGLPVARLICASNANKILTDFINTGVYDKNREFHKTMSPSMDILISSNLERLLYELSDRDPGLIVSWMDQLKDKGCYRVGDSIRARLKEDFWAGFASEEETRAAIRSAFDQFQYLLDPHTAVGYKVYQDYRKAFSDDKPAIIVSTASPFKFSVSVAQAIFGLEAAHEDEFTLLQRIAAASGWVIPKALGELKIKPVRFSRVCAREKMKEALEEWV